MQYNFYIFTIGAFLFSGFGLHLLLITYGNTYLNKLLAVLMLNRAFQMLYFILTATNKIEYFASLFAAIEMLYFAYPACAYLYFRGFIKDEYRLQKKDWLHFIPATVVLLNLMLHYFFGIYFLEDAVSKFNTSTLFYTKINYATFSESLDLVVRSGLIMAYLFSIWRLILQSSIIKNRAANLAGNNWILSLLVVMTLTNGTFLVATIINTLQGSADRSLFLSNYASIVFCFLVLSIIGFTFYNPKILYGYVFVSKDYTSNENKNLVSESLVTDDATVLDESEVVLADSEPIQINKKQITSLLTDNEQLYLKTIISYMEKKEPFLNPDFTITNLSEATAIPVHHCSYIINYVLGENFRDWINGCRIAHFIEEYPINSNAKTILALSVESGFKNKTTFYNSFKKVKGVLPVDYFRAES